MNRDFKYQQRERLIVERDIERWAERWYTVDNKRLRENITIEIDKLFSIYPTQLPCKEYHMDRYERLKKFYSQKSHIAKDI